MLASVVLVVLKTCLGSIIVIELKGDNLLRHDNLFDCFIFGSLLTDFSFVFK